MDQSSQAEEHALQKSHEKSKIDSALVISKNLSSNKQEKEMIQPDYTSNQQSSQQQLSSDRVDQITKSDEANPEFNANMQQKSTQEDSIIQKSKSDPVDPKLQPLKLKNDSLQITQAQFTAQKNAENQKDENLTEHQGAQTQNATSKEINSSLTHQQKKEMTQDVVTLQQKLQGKDQQNEVKKQMEPNLLRQKNVELEPCDNPVEPVVNDQASTANGASAQVVNQTTQQPPDKGLQKDEEEKEKESDGNDQGGEEIVESSPSGRFRRFHDEIGQGAYKKVFKAMDTETGREVAWSVIHLSNLPKSERPRIKSEIKIIEQLKHPNIISFVNAWIDKESLQINLITELITGGSLRQYLARMGKPKLKVIKKWCHEVLEGLKYLHSKKIIHRDIKCDNIFINSNSGEIKIGDLGLSTAMMKTHSESVLGTPEFMAPELYEESYDTAVDIYAFGMALLEMLTREVPYRECTNPAQIYRKVSSNIHPESLDRVLDEQVKNFILWCLEVKSKRPTAEELLNSEFMGDATSENNNKPCRTAPAKAQNQKSNVLADHPEIEPEDEDLPERDVIEDKGFEQGSEKKQLASRLKQTTLADSNKIQTSSEIAPNQKQPQQSDSQLHSQPQQQTEAVQANSKINHNHENESSNQVDIKKIDKKDTIITHGSPSRNKRIVNAERNLQTGESIAQNQNQDAKNHQIHQQINQANQVEGKREQQQIHQKNQQKIKKVDDQSAQGVIDGKGQQSAQVTQADGNMRDQLEERRKTNKVERNVQKSHRVKKDECEGAAAKEKQINVGTLNAQNSVAVDGHRQAVKHQGLYPIKKGFKEDDDDQQTPALLQRIPKDPSQIAEQILSPRKKNKPEQQPKDQSTEPLQDSKKNTKKHEAQQMTQAADVSHHSKDKSNSKLINQATNTQNKEDKINPQNVQTLQSQQSQPKNQPQKLKAQKQINDNLSSQKQIKANETKPSNEKRSSIQVISANDVQSQPTEPSKTIQKQDSVDANAVQHNNQVSVVVEQPLQEKLEKQIGKAEANRPIGSRPKKDSSNNLIVRNQQVLKEGTHIQPQDIENNNQVVAQTQIKNNTNQNRVKKVNEQVPETNESNKKTNAREAIASDFPKKQLSRESNQMAHAQQVNTDNTTQHLAQSSQLHHTNNSSFNQAHNNQKNQQPGTQYGHQSGIHQNNGSQMQQVAHIQQLTHKHSEKVSDKPQAQHKQSNNQLVSQNQIKKENSAVNNSQMIKNKSGMPAVTRPQKSSQQHNHGKETEEIKMTITIKGDEITFPFQLNKDTPQTVAREYVIQQKLGNDKGIYEQFKNEIEIKLDEYYKNKKLSDSKIIIDQSIIQEHQIPQQEAYGDKNIKGEKKQSQTVKQKPVSKQAAGQLQPQDLSPDITQSNKKTNVGHTSTHEKHDKQTTEDASKRQAQKQSQSGQNNQPLQQQQRAMPQQPNKQSNVISQSTKTNENKKSQQVNQQTNQQASQHSTAITNANATQATQPVQAPAHHTPEFLKKRDELKKVYKDMNMGIMKFFKSIKNENMSIDQMLDAMDYQEPKDREFKHRYITKLMEIENEFLNTKKNTAHKPQQKTHQQTHAKEASSQQKQSKQPQHKTQVNQNAQVQKQQATGDAIKNQEKNQVNQHEATNQKTDQSGQLQQTKSTHDHVQKAPLIQNTSTVQQPSQNVKKQSQSKVNQQQQMQNVTVNQQQVASHSNQQKQMTNNNQGSSLNKNYVLPEAAHQQQKLNNQQSSHQTNIMDAQMRVNRIKKAFQKGRDIENMIQSVGNNRANQVSTSTNQNQNSSPTKSETNTNQPQHNTFVQTPIHTIQENGQDDQLFQEEIKKIQDKLQVDQDGIVTRQLIQKMDQYLDKLNYKNEQKVYQLNQLKKQQNQSAQKPVTGQQIQGSQLNIGQHVQKNEEQKQSEKEQMSIVSKNQNQGQQQSKQSQIHHDSKTSGLMTEISKPQQDNNQSANIKKDSIAKKLEDDSESKKEVKMEQGSSGTFNNSRAEDYDGYDPDNTMITHNSHEPECSTKQVLAELMTSDYSQSAHNQQYSMLQEQNGSGRTIEPEQSKVVISQQPNEPYQANFPNQ